MKSRDLAALLHGIELGDIPRETKQFAKIDGLVVVYSPSIDLVEFYGALEGEVDALEPQSIYFDTDGILPPPNEVREQDGAFYYARKKFAYRIDVELGQDGFHYSFTTPIPHKRFVLKNNGERYCRGIIFDICAIGGSEAA